MDVLSRHGLGFLAAAPGQEARIPFHRGLLGHERRAEPYSRPEHLRLALEELGPAFVKLGQLLSTRPDLLPPDYQVELARLQDQAPAVPARDITSVIEAELGAPPEELFGTFETQPLAAASIGQAHAATLRDGRPVVVKVRRPGAVELVEQDLDLLQNVAVRAQRRWAGARDYDVVALAREFGDTLRAELDYLAEGRNADAFAAHFRDERCVNIPTVHWDLTTSRVLTLDRVGGVRVDDADGLAEAGVDRRSLAELATQVTAKMIFEDGFFHADPHPGNLFIAPGPTIGLIDFGMVGRIDARLRRQLGRLLIALSAGSPQGLAAAVLALAPARSAVDRERLAHDLKTLVGRYSGVGIGHLPITPLVEDLVTIVRRHRLQLPHELALLLRMLVMTEGLAARLDPDFEPAEVLGVYAREMAHAEMAPMAVLRQLAQVFAELLEASHDAPARMLRLVDGLERALDAQERRSEHELVVERIDAASRRIERAVLASGVLTAAAVLLRRRPSRRRRRA